MHFEYEIGPEEYVSSQLLYVKLSRDRKRLQWGAICIFGGLGFVLAALIVGSREDFRWLELLLILVGSWWLYAAFLNFFPARQIRKIYRSTDLSGRKFKADVSQDRFEVVGENCTWQVQWSGVRLKGENEKVFVFCSTGGTIFMFGKKYLTDEQQQELRRLAGFVSS